MKMRFLCSFVVILFANFAYISSVVAKRKGSDLPVLKALEGDTITLSCDRGLVTSDTLYAIKWYKDEKEFYRNYPKKVDDPVKVFPIEGFTLQTPLPTPWEVVLRNVNSNASGKYTCMVVDYPRYRTIYRSTMVEVTERNGSQSHPPDAGRRSKSSRGPTACRNGVFFIVLILLVSAFNKNLSL